MSILLTGLVAGAEILRVSPETQHPQTDARPQSPGALVLALERRLAGTKRGHHLRRQIVLAVDAPGVAAGHEEEGRCIVDDDAAGVPDGAGAELLFDLELEAG